MKNVLLFLVPLFFFLFLTSCQKQDALLPETTPDNAFDVENLLGESLINPNQIALEILGQTKWPRTGAAPAEKAWVRPGKVLKSKNQGQSLPYALSKAWLNASSRVAPSARAIVAPGSSLVTWQ